jgi:antitoxin (DNA-binding transcriptional repressor) of toxin-antitoxin stability system
MAAEPKMLDIDDKPEIRALVSEVKTTGKPVTLVAEGEVVAVIQPIDREPGEPGELTEEEHAAFRATSGGWEGIVDVDEFLADNAESRRISSRPPVDL